MQPSSSTRATIVSAENQNGATIVKAKFFFCHYYIVWESNNAGEARGQSWSESLKSRWIPGGSCSYTSGTKRKHFAALSSPRPCWRWLQLQPSCGSPQCKWSIPELLMAWRCQKPPGHQHPWHCTISQGICSAPEGLSVSVWTFNVNTCAFLRTNAYASDILEDSGAET